MERTIKTLGKLSLVALAGMVSPCVVADDSGWYIGGNIGQSRAKIDDDKITSSLLGAGFTTVTVDSDERDTGYKLFGGYQFNRNFALEGGYFDLGEFAYTATTTPQGTLKGDLRSRGVNIDAVGMLPLSTKLSALARIGVIHADTRDSFSGTGAVLVSNPGSHERDTRYKLGLGLQYDFTRSFGMRAEAERYRIDDAIGNKGDIDLFSLGVVYRFGTSQPAGHQPDAVTSETTETKTTALAVVPVPVRTAQYCSILDIQFEINQDTIQREEKEKLAVVGAFMKKYTGTTAVIEGHADGVGTSNHNRALSQHRAESVVSYLTDTYQIAPSRLQAIGYGDTRPVADNNSEEGLRMNRRINAVISCATDIAGLKVIPARTTMAMDMEFDANKADIRPEYANELRTVADFLKANPRVSATVEGHTGNLQATAEEAMAISLQRARNVVNYLVDKHGIDRSRLSAEGFGKTRRYAYNSSAEGQQENRRVNIIFNYRK